MKATNDPLVTFLYLLTRDYLPVGSVEKVLREIETLKSYDMRLCNFHLGEWAEEAAGRLRTAKRMAETP